MVLEQGGVTSVRWSTFMAAAAAMIVAVGLLHVACLHFYPKPQLDPWGISDFYPMSMFKLRLPDVRDQAPLLFLVLIAYRARRLFTGATPLRLFWQIFLATGLLVMSNRLQGMRYGLDYPTASTGTGGFEYYHDAILIKGPLWFLARFNAIQFELLEHARTHPPGPVLLYYFLHHGLGSPTLISIAVGVLSLSLGLPYLRRGLVLLLGSEPPGALFVYALMPAVVIYGIAVVDALIASLFLATLVEFLDEQRRASPWLAACWLALSLCFTFAGLFLLPVLGGFELLRRRRLGRSLMVFGGATLLLYALWFATGFDWVESFRRASAIENDKGFLLFANPRGYLWYRLGAVAEILIFFTPFMAVLAYQGLGKLRREHMDAFTLAWLGPAVLAVMLLAGMLKIGEAARVCIFIVPYLLLPAFVTWRDLDDAGRLRAMSLVFGWGTLMQLFGFYFW
ncbi:MAG: hypothetical protein ABW217_19025 [Polyangiaceae bacterium]